MKPNHSWSVAVVLLFLRTILTEDVDKEHLRNLNSYNNEIKSIEIEASKLMENQASDSKDEYLYQLNKLDKNDKEESTDDSNVPHNRQKRLLWITDDGRLALPPGTTLIIAPTLGLPFVRYPPDGFHANISVSLPLTIDFDKLGLTDNENPLGILPPLFARSMGRAAGSLLVDYIRKHLNRRQKRDLNSFSNEHFKVNADFNDMDNEIPQLPDDHKHAFHGGERALLYTIIEDFISNFGVDGKACLLRAICEVHSKRMDRYGMIGEMFKLFLTASKSPFAELLHEYVEAEEIGKGINGPGECFPFYKDCPKSLFRNSPVTVAHFSEDQTEQSSKSNSGHSM